MLIYVIQYLVHYTFTCNKNGRQGISQGMVNFSLHYIYKNGRKRSRAIRAKNMFKGIILYLC